VTAILSFLNGLSPHLFAFLLSVYNEVQASLRGYFSCEENQEEPSACFVLPPYPLPQLINLHKMPQEVLRWLEQAPFGYIYEVFSSPPIHNLFFNKAELFSFWLETTVHFPPPLGKLDLRYNCTLALMDKNAPQSGFLVSVKLRPCEKTEIFAVARPQQEGKMPASSSFPPHAPQALAELHTYEIVAHALHPKLHPSLKISLDAHKVALLVSNTDGPLCTLKIREGKIILNSHRETYDGNSLSEILRILQNLSSLSP